MLQLLPAAVVPIAVVAVNTCLRCCPYAPLAANIEETIELLQTYTYPTQSHQLRRTVWLPAACSASFLVLHRLELATYRGSRPPKDRVSRSATPPSMGIGIASSLSKLTIAATLLRSVREMRCEERSIDLRLSRRCLPRPASGAADTLGQIRQQSNALTRVQASAGCCAGFAAADVP